MELCQFAGERFIAAFPLQPGPKKIEIVLAPQQFAQDLRIMSHLFQNGSVQWLQNSQLIPDIFHSLAPGMEIFRVRIINRCGKRALAAPVNLADCAANLFPIQTVKWPRHQTRFRVFQLWYRFLLPAGECCGETFESTYEKQRRFDQDNGYGICPGCRPDAY